MAHSRRGFALPQSLLKQVPALCLAAGMVGGAWAQSVALQGMLGSRALLIIDGGTPRSLAVGESALGVKLVTTQLGAPDAKGRRAPEVVPGSEEIIECDRVIVAFGFQVKPENWFEAAGIKTDERGRTVASASQAFKHQTSNPKIFAGGDQVRGADLVVRAVYEGRQAAEGMLGYLGVW